MTRGHRELRKRVLELMQKEELSQNDVARLLDVDSGNFSGLMLGKRNPGLELGARLLTRFGIPLEWWSRPAKPRKPNKAESKEHD